MFQSVQEVLDDAEVSEAERALIAACRAGEVCVRNDATLPPAGSTDPAHTLRADVIRLLALGGSPACGLHAAGVWLAGAVITGTLDLRFARCRGRLALKNCRLAKKPRMDQARLAELSLIGSHFPGLFAQGAKVTGSVFLRGATATGTVDVAGAQIGGQLACKGATLNGGGGKALNAQGARVTGSVFLRGVTATGTVDVAGAQIGGQLACEGAKLNGGGKDGKSDALNAQGARVTADVVLSGVTATGTVDVAGAQIGGQLDCEGATLNGGKGDALDGDKGMALNAQEARVTGSVVLSGITATGTVHVAGAQIGGQLDCTGATLDGGEGDALFAQGARVTESVFLSRVTATGTVHVAGAQIGGQLDCTGATLDGGEGDALFAQGARVEQDFLLRNVAAVTGRVDLAAAHVGDLVDDAASWAKCADIMLDGFTYDRISGDTAPKSYAARRDWLARGSRVKGEFRPQPYTQFARVMRAAGHAAEARRALVERDRLLFDKADKADRAAARAAWHSTAQRGDSGWFWLRGFGRRLWSGLSRRVVGYGHRPEYALFWALGATLFGMVWYFLAWRFGVMVPNSAVILTSPDWLAAMQAAENAPALIWITMPPGQHYETFYALPYALDVFVPLVSLGEDQAWAASTATWPGWLTRWFGFGFQIMGWVVTSLGLAAITGFVQRGAPD